MALQDKINEFLKNKWGTDIIALSGFRAFIIKFLRLLDIGIREFAEGQLTLRAMSLVYITLLSFVPLLAFSFSVLKAFGLHNQIEPFLANFLAPLGPRGGEITQKIIAFVGKMKVGVLGSLGLAMLVYTVISVIRKIEDTFNYIWKINQTRSFARRFNDYISVLLVGPVLIFSALSITAVVMNSTIIQALVSIEPFGTAFYLAAKLIPYILVIAAFTFIYLLIPNMRVKFISALVGGVFAGVLWETAGWAFASFIVLSTKYTAIYSGFAIIIFFMIWLYLNWLILLVGAKVSFCHQFSQFLYRKDQEIVLSIRLKERLAILIMFLIGYNFHHGIEAWGLEALVERLGLPANTVQDVLAILQKRGLIVGSRDEPPAYLPARDIEIITLRDIYGSIRTVEEDSYRIENKSLSTPEVDRIISKVDAGVDSALQDETIKNLVLAHKNGLTT